MSHGRSDNMIRRTGADRNEQARSFTEHRQHKVSMFYAIYSIKLLNTKHKINYLYCITNKGMARENFIY